MDFKLPSMNFDVPSVDFKLPINRIESPQDDDEEEL